MKPRAFQIFLCIVILFSLACWQNAGAQDFGAGLPLVPAEIPQNRRPIQLHSEDGVNFFSGDYKYAIPLPVPVAKGIRPNLSLVYNSTLDRSGVGKGWAIDGIAHVKRSLRHGIPSYKGPGESPEDEFQYQVGTTEGFLVKSKDEPGSPALYYRPKSDDGSMLRFYYLPSLRVWTVYDKNGTVWLLGDLDSAPSGDRISAWYVTEIEDPDGNKISFSYDPAQPDLPTTIKWDVDAFGVGISPSIEFVWTDMNLLQEFQSPSADVHHYENNYTESYRKGYRSDEGRKALDSIKITGYTETGSAYQHVHDVAYQPTQSFGSPSFEGPEIRGSWNLALFDPQDSLPAAELPATKFDYWELPQGFVSVNTVDDPKPAGMDGLRFDQFSLATTSNERVITKLVDMDGDGDLDILSIESPVDYHAVPGIVGYEWKWRKNLGGHLTNFSDKYEPVELPSHCSNKAPSNPEEAPGCFVHSLEFMRGFKDENLPDTCGARLTRKRWYQRVLDVTGDGAADLVYVHRLSKASGWSTMVCRGSITATGDRTFSFCSHWLIGQPS